MISRRRAILAIAAFTLVPPFEVALIRSGVWAGALVLGALFVLYVAAEVVAFELRDHRAAALHRRYEHAAAGPLTGYCPQTDDRYFESVERKNRWAS